jgi:hypothetical protein
MGSAITVVSGLPRSGTSLMMQMLAAGGMPVLSDDVRSADTDNPRGYYEFEPVKSIAEDASWLDDAEGKAVKMVYLLLYELPADREYNVILMQRNLQEVVASQNRMLDRLGEPRAAVGDERLADLLRIRITKAARWLAARQNIRSLTVNYNKLVRHPAGYSRRLIRFLGGHLDSAAMAAVVDPTLYRQKR